MGLSAEASPRPWARFLTTTRVTLLFAVCASYLLGLWTGLHSGSVGSSGTAALLQTCAGASVPVGSQDNTGSVARAIVEDAAAAPETEEQLAEDEQQRLQQKPAAAAAAAAAAVADAPAVAPPPPPRRAVITLRSTLTCTELRALRAQFVAYLTVPNMVPGITTAVMNIIGQMDVEVLLPLIGDLFDRSQGVMMIDIGANMGQTSTAMMQFVCRGSCSRASACAGRPNTGVVAFEPQRRVFEALTQLAAREQWGLCGWQARNAAVSDVAGTMELFGGNTHASLGKKAAWMGRAGFGENKVEKVAVTTVDDVVAELGLRSLFLLKVDTEGFDTRVILGAGKALGARVPRFVLAEYNTKWFEADPTASLRKFVRRMQTYSYLCYVFTARNLVPLTGHWWHPALEFKRWSNILCAQRGDPALELLLRRINTIYAPPVDRCTDGARAAAEPAPAWGAATDAANASAGGAAA